MLMDPDLHRHTGKFYGKYSGAVTDNEDPDFFGRIKVIVPSVFGPDMEVEARPCLPYAHFVVPPVDAKVWIEFEAGDPSFPLWVGVWYPEDTAPESARVAPPQNRVIQTECGHLIELDDTDGEERIAITHKDGSKIEIDKDGRLAIVHHQGSTIEIDKDGKIVLTDAAGDTSIDSQKISLGTKGGAREPLVFGNALVSKLTTIIQTLMTHTHPTGVGPSGPSPDAASSLASMPGTLSTEILSQQNTTD